MKKTFLFTLGILVLVHVPACEANIKDLSKFPWIVRIEKNGNFKCGGILVARKQVITVANCVSGSDLNQYQVFAGFLNGDVKSTTIKDVVMDQSGTLQHLKLRNNMVKGSHSVLRIPRIANAIKNEKVKRETCYLAGWEKDTDEPEFLQIFHEEKLCKGSDDKFCFYYRFDTDTCINRRGAPIVCLVNRRWTFVGQLEEEGCKKKYSQSIQVYKYRAWILRMIINKVSNCRNDQMICNDRRTCASVCNNINECSGGEDEIYCPERPEVCEYGNPDWCLNTGLAGIGVTTAEKIFKTDLNVDLNDCLDACSGVQNCGSVAVDFIFKECLLFATSSRTEIWPTGWTPPLGTVDSSNCGLQLYIKNCTTD